MQDFLSALGLVLVIEGVLAIWRAGAAEAPARHKDVAAAQSMQTS